MTTVGAPSVRTRAVQRWRRWRVLAAVLGLALAVAVIGVLALPRTGAGALDPDSPTPEGSRALAQVLGDRGVRVDRVVRVADAVSLASAAATVLVVRPDVLPPDLVADLAETGADLVLVEPDAVTVDAAGAAVAPAGLTDRTVVEPGCDDPAAAAAGAATAGGSLYRATGAGAEVCFGDDESGAYAVWSDGDRSVTLVGQSAVLANGSIDTEGNATLALRTLGQHEALVWLMASPLDGAASDDGGASPGSLLPGWVGWVALQLGVVALLTMLWRSRRLGRLVPEPLPVVVRSAETAVGRASLYRRAGARDRAGAVLRAASLRRLAGRVGLPAAATGPEVAERAGAAAGRPTSDVHALLLGPPPVDDAALTALADDLDTLEEEVSRT